MSLSTEHQVLEPQQRLLRVEFHGMPETVRFLQVAITQTSHRHELRSDHEGEGSDGLLHSTSEGHRRAKPLAASV
jgi:hypothetical protein